jgi:anti-anti-sigma factor
VTQDGQLVLEVSGDLDAFSAPTLDDAVRAAPSSSIVVDLRAVTFVDTAGLGSILLAHRDQRITLRAPSAYVRSLLDAAGLSGTLHLD